jgi:hypothetical protein
VLWAVCVRTDSRVKNGVASSATARQPDICTSGPTRPTGSPDAQASINPRTLVSPVILETCSGMSKLHPAHQFLAKSQAPTLCGLAGRCNGAASVPGENALHVSDARASSNPGEARRQHDSKGQESHPPGPPGAVVQRDRQLKKQPAVQCVQTEDSLAPGGRSRKKAHTRGLHACAAHSAGYTLTWPSTQASKHCSTPSSTRQLPELRSGAHRPKRLFEGRLPPARSATASASLTLLLMAANCSSCAPRDMAVGSAGTQCEEGSYRQQYFSRENPNSGPRSGRLE